MKENHKKLIEIYTSAVKKASIISKERNIKLDLALKLTAKEQKIPWKNMMRFMWEDYELKFLQQGE